MAHPDLPAFVKAMLSNEMHRTHHHLWHFVRNEQSWSALPDEARAQLTAEGWAAPRFDRQPGSGIDFLGMHREMIDMVNSALASAGDTSWPEVRGWKPIPWAAADDDWPVPDWQSAPPPWASEDQWARFTELAEQARSAARIEEMKELAELFQSAEYLKTVSLDELGIAMEWSIHGWMHMRWSGAPYSEAFSSDPANDWLFVPWSSHSNKNFWKLHGWIDERIGDWSVANETDADLSDAWPGPRGHHGGMMHMAKKGLLEHLPPREKEPMPMMVMQHVVEGLLKRNIS